MAAPALATLQIVDDRHGKEDVPVLRSNAFQLTAEEARVAPDVVTNMYLLLISLFMLIFSTCTYVFCVRIVHGERYLSFFIV